MKLKLVAVAAALWSAQASWAAPMKTCHPPVGLRELTSARDVKFIIFGEEHGTEQSPTMVGDAACALSRKSQRVLVALELQAREDSALRKAWAGSHVDFTHALISTMPEWSTRKDGVASGAMLALLERLHALKQNGRAIDVTAFNGLRDAVQAGELQRIPQPARHEAAQAANILRSASAGRYDYVLVLVGNAHACKRPCHGMAYEPMAMRLAPAARIVSLVMRRGSGTSWNCVLRADARLISGKPSDVISCAVHAGTGEITLGGSPRIALADPASPSSAKGDYGGYYFVGAVTASPPAVGSR